MISHFRSESATATVRSIAVPSTKPGISSSSRLSAATGISAIQSRLSTPNAELFRPRGWRQQSLRVQRWIDSKEFHSQSLLDPGLSTRCHLQHHLSVCVSRTDEALGSSTSRAFLDCSGHSDCNDDCFGLLRICSPIVPNELYLLGSIHTCAILHVRRCLKHSRSRYCVDGCWNHRCCLLGFDTVRIPN